MKQKHIALGIILSIFLAGCGGSGTACDEIVQVNAFSMCLLSDWEQVPEENLRLEGVPEETMAAFQLKMERGGQRDNIVITRERVKSGVAPLQYAETNMKIVEKSPEYMLTEKRELTVDGKDTILHIFSARPVPDLPYSVEETIEQGLITMLSSVSFEAK